MWKTNTKKVLAITLLMVLMFVPTLAMAEVSTNDFANQQESEIMPLFTCIVDNMTDLGISGSTATVDCWVTGHVNTATKAKVIAELQVKSESGWLPVAIWTDTQDSYKASVYETKSVTNGHIYRVKATYTVWEGTASETCTSYTDEITA